MAENETTRDDDGLLRDLNDDESAALDVWMSEHMYRHSISNNINGMSCGADCRTRALAEGVRRHVLIPRREARLAAPDHRADNELRARWEREVLEKFLHRIPAACEAPDYLHALATAMQDTRALLDDTHTDASEGATKEQP